MAQDIEIAAQGGALVEHGSANLLATIADAARDPTVDAAKMTALADLAIKLQSHEQQQQFNRDLNAAIMEMPVITKSGRIIIPAKDGKPERVQGTFARFEDLNRIVKPILQRHNLAITFDLGDEGGKPSCAPILRHSNGWTERGDKLSAPIDTSGSKNNTQAVGSASSYLKRYTMCASLNIVTEGEDDDGTGRGNVTLPHERELAVLEEAKAAFEAGGYMAWFQAQSPKDRAWLVVKGHHQSFGGPALPPPKTVEHNEPRSALERRVQAYVDDIKACADLSALQALQQERLEWFEQLRNRRNDLAEIIIAASSEKFVALKGGIDDSSDDDDLDYGEAPADDLFGADK